ASAPNSRGGLPAGPGAGQEPSGCAPASGAPVGGPAGATTRPRRRRLGAGAGCSTVGGTASGAGCSATGGSVSDRPGTGRSASGWSVPGPSVSACSTGCSTGCSAGAAVSALRLVRPPPLAAALLAVVALVARPRARPL